MNYQEILKHYRRVEVLDEIIEWTKDRWIAIHCQEKSSEGNNIFIRYIDNRPIKFTSEEDIISVLKRFEKCIPRTMYASINRYGELKDKESLYDLDNIYLTTPTWDIDNTIENWGITIKVAKILGDIIREYGVNKSLYYIWSGRGIHVHLHEMAFSSELLRKYHPLDIAYAVVEFIRGKAMSRIYEILDNIESSSLKVENKIDITRVFTAPLSIHRKYNVVTVALKYPDLDRFNLEWIKIDKFKHNRDWRRHEVGEADSLALEALDRVGGYPYPVKGRKRREKPVDKMIWDWLEKYDDGELS